MLDAANQIAFDAVVIAHRLVTVVQSDHVCLLRDGAPESCGTHEEPLTSNAFYASLVRNQTRGLLAEAAMQGAAD